MLDGPKWLPSIIETGWRGDRVTSFAKLDADAAHAAGRLWQHGLRPGDAVLVFHPMSAELYVALLALFRLRLVAMFLDPSAGREHIERCCRLHGCSIRCRRWPRMWTWSRYMVRQKRSRSLIFRDGN